MPSRKQQIYCELLDLGIMHLRSICSSAQLVAKDSNNTQTLLDIRGLLRVAFEDANFLHNIHISILESDFLENDISFINLGFPVYINRLGKELSPEIARLMLEFYNLVPKNLQGELKWHPTEEFCQRISSS